MTPGGTLTCPSCDRRFELRRAGRSPDDDELQIPPVPLLRGDGPGPRGGRRDERAAARRSSPASGAPCASRGAAPPPGGAAASRPLRAVPDLAGRADHKHLLHLDERRIVCVCQTCWSMRSGDARYRPTGSRTLWLDGLRAHRRAVGGVPDPDRPGVLPALERDRRRSSALYPSPAGATESELDLDAWDRLVAANPVLEDLEPDAEALIVNRMATAARARDRAARRLLPARRDHQGDAGRASPAAPRWRPPWQRYFDDLRAAARGERLERDRRPRRRRSSSPSSASSRSRTRRRRRALPRCTSPSPRAARSTRSRSRPRSRSTRRGAATTTRRASGWSSCSARPSAGARRRTRSSGRASTRSCRRSPARPRSRSRCRARTTSRSRRASTSTRCRTARSR